MKNTTTRLLYAFVAIVLVAVLGLLYTQTRSVEATSHNEIVGILRELKQVDAEWNVDVLRVKTGLDSNYDKVASPLPLIKALEVALLSKTNQEWQNHTEATQRLMPLLEKYTTLMNAKVAKIEQFKSQNAILRNSSRFLPVAANELIEATRSSNSSASLKADTERQLNTLLTDTMAYTLTPEETLRQRIVAGTDSLKELTASMPQDVLERTDTLVAHIGTVLKQQEAGTQILAELGALPTAQAIDNLSDANSQENAKLLEGQQIYRQALIAYSAFLLLLLAYAAWRIYRYYVLLNRTNSTLNKANQELKESQVHLVQAEKMSALGQMVAGIAHEINTPLAYVKGTFGVLADQLKPLEQLAHQSYSLANVSRESGTNSNALNAQLNDIETSAKSVIDGHVLQEMDVLLKNGTHGIEQISEIVLNLKNFSRLDREKVSDFSVSAGLDSTLLLANHLIKGKVEIRKYYGDIPKISGSPSQINQVFLNIITNAVQAMPDRKSPNIVTLRTTLEDANTVRIEIHDNGNGIPKSVLPKIFDPFFTTKPVGQGTGMGLSISYKIIQEHGGKLLVDTEEGVGTVFTILLPIKSVQQQEAGTVSSEALFTD